MTVTAKNPNQADVFSFPAVATGYAAIVLADTPYQYYRLGESSGSIADSSGNGFTIAASGTPLYSQTPLIAATTDNAINLTGTSFFVTGNNAVPDYTGNLTVEAWMKLTNNASVARIAARNTGITNGWSCGTTTTPRLIFTAHAVADYTGTVNLTVNTVYYVTYVFDSTTFGVDFYINGVFSQTVAGAAGINASANGKSAVGGRDSTAETWQGMLDEVAIYHSKLSAGRILAHYNAGVAAGFTSQAPEAYPYLTR